MAVTDLAVALIVPGDERSSLARAKDRGAPAVVLDLALTDGAGDVAAARGDVVDALAADGWGEVHRLVRVNAWSSPHTYRDVIEVVEGAGEQLAGIVLPGVRTVHDVAALDLLLTQIEATMGLPDGGVGIVVQLDDARGVQAAAAVAEVARVGALLCNACAFGSAVLLAARAAGIGASCLAGDATRVEAARTDGFDGAWIDDPALVTVATGTAAD